MKYKVDCYKVPLMPKYLLDRGFVSLEEITDQYALRDCEQFNSDLESSLILVEGTFPIRMVAVAFHGLFKEGKEHKMFDHLNVYMQEAACCGFVELPIPFSPFTEEEFELVFEAMTRRPLPQPMESISPDINWKRMRDA